MNYEERGRLESMAAQNQAREFAGERNWWNWLRRVRMVKQIVPPGGQPSEEVLERIQPFLRPNEKWSQFVSRTQLSPQEIMSKSRAEIARIIEVRHADVMETGIAIEHFEPRPIPKKLILDVF